VTASSREASVEPLPHVRYLWSWNIEGGMGLGFKA